MTEVTGLRDRWHLHTVISMPQRSHGHDRKRRHTTERGCLVLQCGARNVPEMKGMHHECIHSTSAVTGDGLTARCYSSATTKHLTRPSCAPPTSHEARGHGAQRMLHARQADDVTPVFRHMPVSGRMTKPSKKKDKGQRTHRVRDGGGRDRMGEKVFIFRSITKCDQCPTEYQVLLPPRMTTKRQQRRVSIAPYSQH